MSLKKVRQELGKSIKDLAKELEVSESFLYQIERGEKYPSHKNMKRIAEQLGYSVQELFFED